MAKQASRSVKRSASLTALGLIAAVTASIIWGIWGGSVFGALGGSASAAETTGHPVQVNYVTQTTVALNWSAQASTRWYTVFWWHKGNEDGNDDNFERAVTPISSYTITGLTSGETYVIRVQPLDAGSFEVSTRLVTSPQQTGTCPDELVKSVVGNTHDYDSDDDGLIDIHCLQHLDAIRHDLDGNGEPDPLVALRLDTADSVTARQTAYQAAFPKAVAGMGCPSTGCTGYELMANLDFDTGTKSDRTDDLYYNAGKGWAPIVGRVYPSTGFAIEYRTFEEYENTYRSIAFTGTFEGNGLAIANLLIDRSQYYVGLFGLAYSGSVIRNVRLTKSSDGSMVRGYKFVGPLAGLIWGGTVSGSYSQLPVEATYSRAGGLIGGTYAIGTPFATVQESYATGRVTAHRTAGGLVGRAHGTRIIASFATGDVHVTGYHYRNLALPWPAGITVLPCISGGGGLVGELMTSGGVIAASYSTGDVMTDSDVDCDVTASKYHYGNGPLVGLAYGGMQRTMRTQGTYATGSVTDANGSARGLFGECWEKPYHDVFPDDKFHPIITADIGFARDRFVASYFNSERLMAQKEEPICGEGKTTSELQSPTDDAPGIYSTWNGPYYYDRQHSSQTIPGLTNPWSFGDATQYPKLIACFDKPGIDGGGVYCPVRGGPQPRQ